MNTEHNYFRWLVLAGAFAILFLVQGSRSIIGVAFKPIVAEFGWMRGSFSLVLSAHMAIFALMLPVVGRCFDRYGAKGVIIISSLCLTLGYVGITATQSLWAFMVLYGLFAAIGFGGCSVTLFGAVTSKWFQRHRGMAVSLAMCGGPVGQFVMIPPATHVIHTYGWRWVFIALALFVLVVSLGIATTLMKPAPPHNADLPEGAGTAEKPAPDSSPLDDQKSKGDLSLVQAMGTPSFWFFTILMAVCGGGDYLVITHLVPMVTDAGISAQTAGSMMAWFGLMGMAGLMITGPVSDRFGNKLPAVATFVLRAAIFTLILFHQSATSFYVFALVFGFTMFITAPITTTLLAKLYGLSNIGLISGFVTTIHHLGGGLWIWLGGAAFDRFGSYDIIFGIYAGFAVIAFFCGILIKEKRHQVANLGCNDNS
ncbi:MAG: MFS transporter [Desulfobacteraceae bacterium]|jgi:predicted MFS family arabinose efflux permease